MNPRRARAFTLLEALIAVGMILLLAGALAMFVSDLGSTRDHITRNTDRARSAESIFSVIETALQTAVVDGGSHGAGVSGTDSRLRVLSSRTDAAGGNASELARAAFAPLVATEVQQGGQTVTIGRSGTATALPAPIGAIQMRYFDGEAWSDYFDSLDAGRLPTMVEVAVWFDAPLDAESETAELPAPDRVRRIAVPDALATDGRSADEPASDASALKSAQPSDTTATPGSKQSASKQPASKLRKLMPDSPPKGGRP